MNTTELTNSDNQLDIPPNTWLPKRPTGNNMGLGQAYQLRNLSAKTALSLEDAPYGETETHASRAQAICALIRAWAEATDRIRILRGKPLPGSLRPERKPTKKKQISSAPSEEPSGVPSREEPSGSMPTKE